jgi:hypothetical protein
MHYLEMAAIQLSVIHEYSDLIWVLSVAFVSSFASHIRS